MKRFEYLEDEATADIAVKSYGTTLGEAFVNMALAMFNVMTPLEKIEPKVERTFEVSSRDLGELLYNFLEEFLFVIDVENLVFSRISVELDEDKFELRARCWGEPFDLERHEAGVEIKAITYHLMEVKREGYLWSLRVVFDI